MNKPKPNFLFFLLGRLAVGIPFGYVFILIAMHSLHFLSLSSQKAYWVDSTWEDHVGVFSKFDHGPKGNGSTFDYEFKNKSFGRVQSHGNLKIYGLVIGEKYIIKINPKDPSRYYPVNWKPVFTADEQTDTTTGTILKCEYLRDHTNYFFYNYKIPFDTISNYKIRYEYRYSDKIKVREQFLSPYNDATNKHITAGQRFMVVYLTKLPERAILYTDKVNGDGVR